MVQGEYPQIVWKTGKVQLPKADLETTFLHLAKDERRRKEIKEEEDEFQKELLQQSSSKKNRTRTESTFLEKKKEVFTLPHLFRTASTRTARNPCGIRVLVLEFFLPLLPLKFRVRVLASPSSILAQSAVRARTR